jgi:archaellum component FlaC
MADATSYDNAIDGSATEVRSHSRYYAGIAEAIADTMVSLQAVTNGLTTRSDAVDAFSAIATEVRENLSEVEDRYKVVAEQLAIYATALSSLKSRAATIQRLAREANEQIPNKEWRHSSEQTELFFMLPDDPKRPKQEQYVENLGNQLWELRQTVSTANRDLQELLDEWRGVADRCADAIQGVVQGSDINDDFGDWLAGIVEDVLPALEFWLDIISIVLTVVAILVIFTGVGAALAPALMLLARGAQLLSRAIKIIRIVCTVALVAAGKLPPTKLIDLAVDFALDKIGGKIGDAITDKVGGALVDKFGKEAQKFLRQNGLETAAENMADIRKHGFDDWMGDTFAKGIDLDDWAINGVELDDIRVGDFHFELDDFGSMVTGANDSLGNIVDLNFSGSSGVLDGFAWSVADLGIEMAGGSTDVGTPIQEMYENSQRPSYDQLVSTP